MKILVFCLPAIGDALMATPMIKLLKQKYPKAQIDIAYMFDAVEYVFKNNPNIHKAYKLSLYTFYNNKYLVLKQLLNLRNKRYDLSILAFPSYRREYHLIQYVIGAKRRIAHFFHLKGYWTECNFFNTHLIAFDEKEHNVINNLNLLKALNINWQDEIQRTYINYDFTLDKKDNLFGKKYLSRLTSGNKNIISVHPGSTTSPAALLKRWPIDRYAKVINYLIKDKKSHVLVFVGENEIELGRALLQQIKSRNNCTLIENINFEQAVGILNNTDMLICNDNGFGHVAVAFKKPIITLFAPTNHIWTLPFNTNGLVKLINPVVFKPWYRYELKRQVPNGAISGMDKITVRQVINEIDKVI